MGIPNGFTKGKISGMRSSNPPQLMPVCDYYFWGHQL